MPRAAVAFVEFDGDFSKLESQTAAQSKKLEGSFASSFKRIAEFGTAAVVGIAGGLVGLGEKFDGAFNTIARGTGATGKVLAGLDQSFKNVLKSGSGSFDQVSQAVTKLFQRTGLTGKALDQFAAKEVTLARITKTDVGDNLESTTKLFNVFGIAASKQSDELDVLFRASQVAGESVSQLAGDMQAAAPVARILGLSIDQTADLVANLEKAGLPASRVLQGLASSFVKAAKAGKSPLSVIQDLVKQVKAAPNATVAATIAISKFGIGARQAAILVAGLRNGTIDLTQTLDGGKGINATAQATATLSGALEHLKNIALVGLEPLATKVLDAVTAGVQAFTNVVPFLTQIGQLIQLAVQIGFGRQSIAGIHGWLAIFATIGVIVRKVVDFVRGDLADFGRALLDAFHSQTFRTIVDGIVLGFLFVRDVVDKVFRFIKGVIDKVGPPLESLFSKMTKFFTGSIGARVAEVAVALALLGAGAAAVTSSFLAMGSQIASIFQGLSVLGNPIVLAVVGLTLLAGAFLLAYKNSKTFRDLISGIGSFVKKEFDAIVSGFQNPSARIGSGLDAVTATVTRLGQVAGKVFNAVASFWAANGEKIIATAKRVALAVTLFIGSELLGGFKAVSNFLAHVSWGDIFNRVAADVTSAISHISQVLAPVVSALVPLSSALLKFAISLRIPLEALLSLLPTVLAALFVVARVAGVIVGAALRVLAVVVSFLADNMGTLTPILLAAAGAFAAFKVVKGTISLFQSVAKTAASGISSVKEFAGSVQSAAGKVTGFFKAGGGADTLRLRLWAVRDAMKTAASAIASGAKTAVEWGKSALSVAASAGKQAAAFLAEKAAAIASAVAQKALAAAQWLLNAAMDANPIVLIVAALVALGLAVFEAYKHFGPFHDAVDAAWQILQSTFHWIVSNWPLLLAILTGPIGIAVLLIVKNFDRIKGFVSGVFDWVSQHWPLLLEILTGFFKALPGRILGFLGAVGSAALKFGGAILHGILNGIGGAADAVGGFVEDIGRALKSLINRVVIDPLKNFHFTIGFHEGPLKFSHTFEPFGSLPTLDTGAVLAKPTIALLAAQSKAQPEIVTPERLMRKVFADELANASRARVGPITTRVDGTGKLAEFLQELFDDHDRQLEATLTAGARG